MKKRQHKTTVMLSSKSYTNKIRKFVNHCFDTQSLLGVETNFNYRDQPDGSVFCIDQTILLTFTNVQKKKSESK